MLLLPYTQGSVLKRKVEPFHLSATERLCPSLSFRFHLVEQQLVKMKMRTARDWR